MTTRQSDKSKEERQPRFVLPDIPEREPDDMTSSKHLSETGNVHHLIHHLGNLDTTLVSGERYMCQAPGTEMRYPDLFVAYNARLQDYYDSNGYIVSEQGKPPDFVLEIASRATGTVDTEEKPRFYSQLGVPEYWRFDETGAFHGTRLAGDRLAGNHYESIPIEELAGGVLQGYSTVLNLHLRWEEGQLRWHDPETGRHIATFTEEREARLQEQQAYLREREARIAAEARVRDLEAELARRSTGQ